MSVDILNQVKWLDILDILLVWIIIYRVLLLIKGTRALHMIAGLGLLLLVSIISRYLNLYTMDWLIQSFWAYIAIAVIILFQPEIRRILAHVGSAPFRPFTSAEELKSLDEIVKATISLSARKIGALIVIERDINLNQFIEIGMYLDARVSREIILSIFHPSSPLHDGAVVIKGNRLVAAGCFLPINLRSNLDKEIGTRHRAALAITEETDAVTVIVSEEKGTISIAIGNKIETKLDMVQLRAKLTSLFTESSGRRQ